MENPVHKLKSNFITGLVILLPLVLTAAILGFLINFLTKPFVGLVSKFIANFYSPNQKILFLSHEEYVLYLSKFLVLLALFIVTLFLGLITRIFFMKSILGFGDKILHRIPIVNTVYRTTQDIIKTLFVSNKNSFKQVVMVPFPNEHQYMIGLVSRESPQICSDAVNDSLISVLIPTTPNPTTGFLVMVKQKDLKYLDMRPEEAIKYIVSCGVIIPHEKIK